MDQYHLTFLYLLRCIPKYKYHFILDSQMLPAWSKQACLFKIEIGEDLL